MVNVMCDNGYKVISTDIITGIDYLATESKECDWIITNPPFSRAHEFIEQSIRNEKPFAFLLKSQYWHAQKRHELFLRHRPYRKLWDMQTQELRHVIMHSLTRVLFVQ